MQRRIALLFSFAVIALVATSNTSGAANGEVLSHQKISDTQGGFTGILDNGDRFGIGVTSLGLLDGDNVADLAAGANMDDDGGLERGAVWILFLNSDGTVKSHQKISATQGSFTGGLDDGDRFGSDVTLLGDLDGDAVTDIAVTAPFDDDGGTDRGATWILFLNSDGTVKSHQKISDTQGNFTGVLDDGDFFGTAITQLGDLDGDGVVDLAVGAQRDDDGGTDRGAAWILFLNSNGTVKSHQKISDTQGNFTGALNNADLFGNDVAGIGDLDGDNIVDMVAGAQFDDDGGTERGAAWILFLNSDGTVKSHQKISDTQGNFTGTLDNVDLFGIALELVGDLDCDGVGDLAVGAYGDDDGGSSRGAVWILFLNSDGTVKSHQKISATQGNFAGGLANFDAFGREVASLGDINGDNIPDLAVSAPLSDDGGSGRGAIYVLSLDGTDCTVPFDIMPAKCPNVVNVNSMMLNPPPGQGMGKKGGVLVAAVLGTASFDVNDVDVTTLQLAGVASATFGYSDVAAPLQGGEACDCTSAGPDGFTDLSITFNKVDVLASLGPIADGAEETLTLTGTLLSGTPFAVNDCIQIRVKGTGGPPPDVGPRSAVLLPAKPNPFNPTTHIRFVLSSSQRVRLAMYDAVGRLVDTLEEGVFPAGEHVVTWNAANQPSGIYFYRLEAGNFSETRKIVLLK